MKKRIVFYSILTFVICVISLNFKFPDTLTLRNKNIDINVENSFKVKSVKKLSKTGCKGNIKWINKQNKLFMYKEGSFYLLDINSNEMEKVLTINSKGSYVPFNISNDGNKIVFREKNIIYIYDLVRRKKKEIFTDKFAISFDWSPNNKKILYQSEFNVWVYSVETNVRKKITSDKKFSQAKWSPKGDKVAALESFKWNLWIFNPDGTNMKKIIEKCSQFYWAPNGTEIYYEWDLCIYKNKLNETESKKILEITSDIKVKYVLDNSFSISDDGTMLAYTYNVLPEDGEDLEFDVLNRLTNTETFVYFIKTEQKYNITNTKNQTEIMPTWSSDDKKILCFIYKRNSGLINSQTFDLIPLIIKFE